MPPKKAKGETTNTAIATRIGATTALGGLAGRTAAWHPLHGGRMNRGTLIGAGLGAAVSAGTELIGSKVAKKPDQKFVARAYGPALGTAGLAAAINIAAHKAEADQMDGIFSRMSVFGEVSEKSAKYQNAKHMRATGMDGGETFIPRFGKQAGGPTAAQVRKGAKLDEIGGTVEDKLRRLHQAAKGTPEGDAALRKLNELRGRQGKTISSKISKVVSHLSKLIPRRAGKTVRNGALLMSATDQLNEILEFNSITYHETEAEIRTRKARGHREKADEAIKIGRVASTAAAVATLHPGFRKAAEDTIRRVGGGLEGTPYPKVYQAAKFAHSNPGKVLNRAAWAAPVAIGGAALIHKIGAWHNDKKANAEFKKANALRKERNAKLQGHVAMSARDQLDSIIQLGAKNPLRKLSDIIPTKMTKEEIAAAEERLRRKMRPGKLAPMGNMPASGSSYMSAREHLIQLSGGYVNTEDGVKRAKGAHLLRHGFTYGGAVIGTPLVGGPIGALIDAIRRKKAKKRTADEGFAPPEMALLSARDELDAILQFADPRPRNDLGMFTGTEEGGPSPDAISVAYKQQAVAGAGSGLTKGVGAGLAGGAVSGVGALSAQGAIKSLLKKVRGVK